MPRAATTLLLVALLGWAMPGLAQVPEREGAIVVVIESGEPHIDAEALRTALTDVVDQAVLSLAQVGPRDPDALLVVAFSPDGMVHMRLHTRSGLRTAIAATPGADADSAGRWLLPHVAELLRSATEELGNLGGAPVTPSGLATWDGTGVVVTSHRSFGLPRWPVPTATPGSARGAAGERADGLSTPHPQRR